MRDGVILGVQDLCLSFGGVQALSRVSLEVKTNAIAGLIGPNGSGKTCLLNCISGCYRPRTGSIVFRGHDITRLAPHKIARLGIGRTFQRVALYSDYSVLDNIMLARCMHGSASLVELALPLGRACREEASNRAVVEEIIEFLHLEEIRKMPVGSLSLGQRRLVEIGRALATGAKLVLLDEPAGGMDTAMKRVITDVVVQMREAMGLTVLLIEHDMGMIMNLAEHVVVLDHGEKIADGTPAEVASDPKVMEAYLGGGNLRG